MALLFPFSEFSRIRTGLESNEEHVKEILKGFKFAMTEGIFSFIVGWTGVCAQFHTGNMKGTKLTYEETEAALIHIIDNIENYPEVKEYGFQYSYTGNAGEVVKFTFKKNE
jgi:hypothetical protein